MELHSLPSGKSMILAEVSACLFEGWGAQAWKSESPVNSPLELHLQGSLPALPCPCQCISLPLGRLISLQDSLVTPHGAGSPTLLALVWVMGIRQARSAEQRPQFLPEETGSSWPIWSLWNYLVITRVFLRMKACEKQCHNWVLVGLWVIMPDCVLFSLNGCCYSILTFVLNLDNLLFLFSHIGYLN